MDVEQFRALINRITEEAAGVPLDASLEAHLDAKQAPGSYLYDQIFEACKVGVRDGWLCNREADGVLTASA